MSQKYLHDQVVPDETSLNSKKEQVASMFNRIAGRYDFLNRFLSAGIDVGWRKKALALLSPLQPKTILDVATGTADVAIMAAERLRPHKIIGIDIADRMLDIGRQKINVRGWEYIIELQNGDSETINFPDDSFDAVTISFGVRNFENLEKGLSEIYRVLKPGGRLVVLEFSKPLIPGFKQVYNGYMKLVAPQLVSVFASDKKAYQYLNQSIQAFPEGKQFVNILKKIGFKHPSCKPLTLGICSIYWGDK
ncbi:MAG: bifunctional demethylmenaquinone methyltransferase/2-methoxy-6-polyprenyl-1,4-benzoquinol methylase UbiE [Chitinophagaceae bacterium]